MDIPTTFHVLYSIIAFMYVVLILVWEDQKGVPRWKRIACRLRNGR